MTEALSYRAIQALAAPGSADPCAAELHGTMTGLLCADVHATYEQWLGALFAADESPFDASAEIPLRRLFAATQHGLAAGDLGFEPLLPDDEETLAERARALGNWCTGFLFGLGQRTGARTWSGDSEELLKDFAEIARLDATDDPSEEADYVEVAEFVRIGVQLIRCECEGPASSRIH